MKSHPELALQQIVKCRNHLESSYRRRPVSTATGVASSGQFALQTAGCCGGLRWIPAFAGITIIFGMTIIAGMTLTGWKAEITGMTKVIGAAGSSDNKTLH